jgi:hypothetical protein
MPENPLPHRIGVRALENLHIPLWLCKDTSWMLGWKTMGTAMIVPTVGVAVWILLRTWQRPMRLPNLAVLCWILANGTWMLGEFYAFDFKPISLGFFLAGLAVIAVFFMQHGFRSMQD